MFLLWVFEVVLGFDGEGQIAGLHHVLEAPRHRRVRALDTSAHYLTTLLPTHTHPVGRPAGRVGRPGRLAHGMRRGDRLRVEQAEDDRLVAALAGALERRRLVHAEAGDEVGLAADLGRGVGERQERGKEEREERHDGREDER